MGQVAWILLFCVMAGAGTSLEAGCGGRMGEVWQPLD